MVTIEEFKPNEKEEFWLSEWEYRHKCSKTMLTKARLFGKSFGEGFTRSHSHKGGIGIVFATRCNKCHLEETIADVGCW